VGKVVAVAVPLAVASAELPVVEAAASGLEASMGAPLVVEESLLKPAGC